ncbi:MAG: large subunit ribosomal protein L24 [Maribacter sp.]|jgi:large subunit ribosomal protein L24
MSKKVKQTRFAPKFHLKKGDKVVVIAGSSKGATGDILEVQVKKYRAIVDGVNLVKKHTRPTETNPGGINDIPAPIHLSNLMLIDSKSGEPTRTGRKIVDGKSVRYSKKSGEIIK